MSGSDTQEGNGKKKSFWVTLPGIQTGFAALVTAITGLIAILNTDNKLPEPVTGTPAATTTPTVDTERPPISSNQPTPELRLPDLFISEFKLTPSTPIQKNPVSVRMGVYNKGATKTQSFSVQWWPGENYPKPACTWTVQSLVARGGKILTCEYSGYPSWYGRITTKVVADSGGKVRESVEKNNVLKKTISVSRP